MSRRVAEFEEALGVRLIERSARSLELTEAGQLLLARTDGPMHEVAEALAAARDGVAAPRGRLRVAAPMLFSQVALGRLAARFVALYPEVQVEAVADDRLVDLVDARFDVAIRINPSKDSALVLAAASSVRMPDVQSDLPPKVPAVVGPTYREGDLWTVDGSKLTIDPQPGLRLSSFLMVRDAI